MRDQGFGKTDVGTHWQRRQLLGAEDVIPVAMGKHQAHRGAEADGQCVRTGSLIGVRAGVKQPDLSGARQHPRVVGQRTAAPRVLG